jgi:hypothetical protein
MFLSTNYNMTPQLAVGLARYYDGSATLEEALPSADIEEAYRILEIINDPKKHVVFELGKISNRDSLIIHDLDPLTPEVDLQP